MTIRFTKMHGLGNDYVYVDCFNQSLAGHDLPALARTLSDRHRGVGSDGLILICPPQSRVDADCRMEMYNADGSRGEMCGNGIRCVAKYVLDHRLVNPQSAIRNPQSIPLRIQTDRGVLSVTAFASYSVVKSARVDMGQPIVKPKDIPVAVSDERCVRQQLQLGDERLVMTCVSMGNPHAVFFVDSFDRVDLAHLGPLIENHSLFPNRINVHFVTVRSRREATMHTWERGAGLTLACGTGACAVLVAGVLEDRMDRSALIHLPGGDLQIEWTERGAVLMTGPAEEVFSGEWRI